MDITKEMVANIPPSHRMRLYVVSYLALYEARHEETPEGKTEARFFHSPNLIQAQGIDIAVQMACKEIDTMWPKSDGWRLRSVAIEPVSAQYLKQLLQFVQIGLFAGEGEPEEKGIVIDLDGPPPDPQDTISIETDKPAS